jgi:hypothetical protein
MKAPEPSCWVWLDAQARGPFTVTQLYRMSKSGSVDHHTLYWSDAHQTWLPLGGILWDVFPREVPEIRDDQMIEVMCSDLATECVTCRRLDGRKFRRSELPLMPPAGCTCEPWCRCVLVLADHAATSGASSKPALPASAPAPRATSLTTRRRRPSPPASPDR